MKVLPWFIAIVVGFGMMASSYIAWQQIDQDVPWASGIMVIATDDTAIDDEANVKR